MDLIPSFTIDHTKLLPGVYISRVDEVAGSKVTTYDIRLKRPNVEPCAGVGAMHTLAESASFARRTMFSAVSVTVVASVKQPPLRT